MATATKSKAKAQPMKNYSSRLKGLYYDTLVKEMMDELKLKNVNQVPKLEKIVLNIGLGKAKDDKKMIEVATNTLRKISGQQPIQTFAKKSIASFKLREGNVIGLKECMNLLIGL
jgi:large subunit ribosomal protein L5